MQCIGKIVFRFGVNVFVLDVRDKIKGVVEVNDFFGEDCCVEIWEFKI